jgi:hypothetical protein
MHVTITITLTLTLTMFLASTLRGWQLLRVQILLPLATRTHLERLRNNTLDVPHSLCLGTTHDWENLPPFPTSPDVQPNRAPARHRRCIDDPKDHVHSINGVPWLQVARHAAMHGVDMVRYDTAGTWEHAMGAHRRLRRAFNQLGPRHEVQVVG